MDRVGGLIVGVGAAVVLANTGCSAARDRTVATAGAARTDTCVVGALAPSVCRLIVNGNGGGTGFVLHTDRADGIYVVTAFHVVADAGRLNAVCPSQVGAPWELALEVVREDPA